MDAKFSSSEPMKAVFDTGAGVPTLQEKSATPSESAQEITADTGYDGLSKVNVDAVSSLVTRHP